MATINGTRVSALSPHLCLSNFLSVKFHHICKNRSPILTSFRRKEIKKKKKNIRKLPEGQRTRTGCYTPGVISKDFQNLPRLFLCAADIGDHNPGAPRTPLSYSPRPDEQGRKPQTALNDHNIKFASCEENSAILLLCLTESS